MKKILKLSAFIFLILWVSTASAAYEVPTISANDHSMQYLYYIFGDVGGLFTDWNSTINKDGGENSLLGIMFQQFNYGVSVLAIFIFAYIYGKGILDTAAEGQFLGKKGSSLWVPIRGILGLILLVPTSAGGGYNIAQIFVMWIVMQGIALADSVWKVAVIAMGEGRGVTLQTGDDLTAVGQEFAYQQSVSNIFKSLVCTYAVKYREEYTSDGTATGKTVESEQYLLEAKNSDTDANGIQFLASIFDVASDKPYKRENCGSVTWKNMQVAVMKDGKLKYQKYQSISKTNLQEGLKFRQEWQDLIVRLIEDLEPLAENFVASRAEFDTWPTDVDSEQGQSVWTDTDASGANIVKEAYDDYVETVGKEGPNGYVYWLSNQLGSSVDADSSTEITDSKFTEDGWIMAGSYYTNFKNMRPGSQIDESEAQALLVDLPDPTKDNGGVGESTASKYRDVSGAYKAAGNYFDSMIQATGAPDASDGDPNAPAENDLDTTGSRQTFEKFILKYGLSIAGVTAAATAGAVAWAGSGIAMLPVLIALIVVMISGTMMLYSMVHSTSVDPIYLLSVYGTIMLTVAAVAYAVSLGTMWVAGLGSSFGQCLSGFANAYTSTSYLVSMSILVMVAGLVAFGSMLTVYLPMLFFIYFSVAALFWFMLIVELMIIVVIGVLGVMMPEGGHDLWGMSQQTVFLILSAYLRPVMMIIGLIAASFVSVVAIRLISAGFYDAMLGATYGGWGLFNPMVVLLYMMLYITMCITAVSVPLKLISSIPDVCMTGIGFAGAGISQKMDQAAGDIKGQFGKGAGGMGAGMANKGKLGNASKKAGDKDAAKAKGEAGGVPTKQQANTMDGASGD